MAPCPQLCDPKLPQEETRSKKMQKAHSCRWCGAADSVSRRVRESKAIERVAKKADFATSHTDFRSLPSCLVRARHKAHGGTKAGAPSTHAASDRPYPACTHRAHRRISSCPWPCRAKLTGFTWSAASCLLHGILWERMK